MPTGLLWFTNMSSDSLFWKLKYPEAVPQKPRRFKVVFVNRTLVLLFLIKALRLPYRRNRYRLCRLAKKHGLRNKTRTKHYRLRIKYGLTGLDAAYRLLSVFLTDYVIHVETRRKPLVYTCFVINSFVFAPAGGRPISRLPTTDQEQLKRCSQHFCFFNIPNLPKLERTL